MITTTFKTFIPSETSCNKDKHDIELANLCNTKGKSIIEQLQVLNHKDKKGQDLAQLCKSAGGPEFMDYMSQFTALTLNTIYKIIGFEELAIIYHKVKGASVKRDQQQNYLVKLTRGFLELTRTEQKKFVHGLFLVNELVEDVRADSAGTAGSAVTAGSPIVNGFQPAEPRDSLERLDALITMYGLYVLIIEDLTRYQRSVLLFFILIIGHLHELLE